MRLISTFVSLLLFAGSTIANGKHEPDLKISLDRPNGQQRNPKIPLTRFSSKLTFHQTDDVWKDILKEDDNKLSQVAKDAWWQMNTQWLTLKTPAKQRPLVMTALAIKGEMYLSSSLKGGHFAYYAQDETNPVYQSLLSCNWMFESEHMNFDNPNQAPGSMEDQWSWHKNAASCGEVMALFMYFQEHPDGEEALKDGHIVTVRNEAFRTAPKDKMMPYEKIVRFDPCGAAEHMKKAREGGKLVAWGCYQFTDQFNLNRVMEHENLADGFDDSFNLPTDRNQMTPGQVSLQCNPPSRK